MAKGGIVARAEKIMGGGNPLIRGLVYHYSEVSKITKDGREIVQYIQRERPLVEGDILAQRDYGTHVVIVAKDGRRYKINNQGG